MKRRLAPFFILQPSSFILGFNGRRRSRTPGPQAPSAFEAAAAPSAASPSVTCFATRSKRAPSYSRLRYSGGGRGSDSHECATKNRAILRIARSVCFVLASRRVYAHPLRSIL